MAPATIGDTPSAASLKLGMTRRIYEVSTSQQGRRTKYTGTPTPKQEISEPTQSLVRRRLIGTAGIVA